MPNSESKKITFAYMRKLGWAYESLPWFGQELAETKAAIGNGLKLESFS